MTFDGAVSTLGGAVSVREGGFESGAELEASEVSHRTFLAKNELLCF